VCRRISGTEGPEEGGMGILKECMKKSHKIMGKLNPNKQVNTSKTTRQNTIKITF